MKATYVPNRLTPMTVGEAAAAFAEAFREIEGAWPTRKTLCVLVGHSALETGYWKSMHCWCPGNSKATEQHEGLYTSFRCSEVLGGVERFFLPEGECDRTWKLLPHSDRYEVPPAMPWTRFQAFETAAEGVKAHLLMLKKRWPGAYQAARNGQTELFCRLLKAGRYFTADEAQYTKDVVSIVAGLMGNPFTDMSKQVPPPLPRVTGTAPVDNTPRYTAHPTITLGSRGPAVREFQRLMGTKEDGIFGPGLQRIAIAWQVANGLKPDGLIGPVSWMTALKKPPPPRDAA